MKASRSILPLLLAVVAVADVPHSEAVDYTTQIKPLLQARCYACHGALKQEAGLRLDTGQNIRNGSRKGPVVSVSGAKASRLLQRVASGDTDFRMPPEGAPLSDDEIHLLQAWIEAGAQSPEDETPEADPQDHWAFKPPVKPDLPAVANTAWPRNVIDFHLLAGLEERGLAPAPDAEPSVLLRRLYLDLTGLPPSPEQLQAFLQDPSEEKYLETVDRLLASPRHGERWARHWMDVWRYSDWYGRRRQNDVRNSAPQIWRWRDWIVDSLNNDKSYARMIQEMLAGDEIAANDDTAWPATGYLVRNYYSLNPNEWMRDNLEYTAKAFLGLTFNCAHCHDHKYDPISHEDYFRLRAFFEPIGIRQDRVVGEAEPPPFERYKYGGSRKVVRLGMARIYDEKPEEPTWFYTGGDERNKLKDRGSVKPGVPSFLNVPFPEVAPVELPMTAWYPGSRASIQKTVLTERQAAIRTAEGALGKLKTVDATPYEARLKEAQRAFDRAMENAKANGEAGALSGRQSVLLDAGSGGRRILQNRLSKLKSVPDGSVISFRIRILKDDHVNFQLARDTTKQLTALYVGFAGGKIRSYRPGGFKVFDAASYDFNKGENDFHVKLELDPKSDTAKLFVTPHNGETALVDGVSIGLNGWNAAKKPNQPMTFDCRTGTRALIDDVSLTAGDQRLEWDFEAPTFSDGMDIGGIADWFIHKQSAAQAISEVSMIAACESARPSYEKLQKARAALKSATQRQTASELRVKAARLKLRSAEATIAADNARMKGAAESQIGRLSKAARSAQREADETNARWRILDIELRRIAVSALPATDKTKSKKLKAIDKELTTANADLKKALSAQTPSGSPFEYTPLSRTTTRTSTGRRSALARWITDSRNPLTARVAVNHIWARHFNAPLVPSVADFGRNGKPPTHPEALDWLAVELMENNWSMKRIHRLIVTSRAYRMSSSGHGLEANRKADADNRYLWRMNQGRMESETVRDNLLAIAGSLNGRFGGQPLTNPEAEKTFRRSLYYEVYPEGGGHNPLGEVFDPPDPTECFRRTATIVPQQALAMSNSRTAHLCSERAVKRIAGFAADSGDDAFIEAAFAAVLSRPPVAGEMEACRNFLARQREEVADEAKARASLARVLFNHNDFVTIR